MLRAAAAAEVPHRTRRAHNGLTRTGRYGAIMSGEFVVAFTAHCKPSHCSTERELPSNALTERGAVIGEFLQVALEAIDKNVLNTRFTAHTVRS